MKNNLPSTLGFLYRPRLGIEVGRRTVRSVLVVKGRIASSATVPLDGADSLGAALDRAIEASCRGLWRKPRVFTAIGASSSQLRRLVNLPAISAPRALREVVRGSAGRFFLKNGVPLLTSSVRWEREGAGWAAALDEPPIRAVAEACRPRGLRLEVAAPVVVCLQRVMAGELLVAEDGDVRVEARVAGDGSLSDVRRATTPRDAPACCHATPTSVLEALGSAAAEYAGAYGATVIEPSEPLALHARELRQWQDATVPRWRLLLAGGALVMAVALAVLLPPLAAGRAGARAASRLAAINGRYRAAHWTEVEFDKTTTALDEIDAFQRNRRSMIAFLAEVTANLPENAWLQSIRLDQDGGTAVTLAPRAAAALAGLAAVKSITSPIIVGAVSNEQVGGDRIERVTVRFRWRTPMMNAPPTRATTAK